MLTAPLVPNTQVDITSLTHATVEGNGVFDVLMRAVNAHLQKEWSANRLKGTEYSTVYLGALESTMSASLQFVLAKDKANAELDILKQQLVNLKVEEANAIKQGLQLTAQTAVTTQQKVNLEDELLTAAKQRESIDSEITVRNRQIAVTEAQSTKDLLVKEAQIVQTAQQTSNLLLEAANIPKQGQVLDKQVLDAIAKTALTEQQKLNAVIENTVLTNTATKVIAEKELLNQKKVTEEAQVDPGLIIPNSILDRQRAVLTAQANGYARDAEQKTAEIMLRGYSVLATNQDLDGTASTTYGVSPTNVSSAITKLLAGI